MQVEGSHVSSSVGQVRTRGLAAVCKTIGSTRRGALVYPTSQGLRLPHRKVRLNQTTCNHLEIHGHWCCGTENGLWAQIRNRRSRGPRTGFNGKSCLGVTSAASCSTLHQVACAWSTPFLKISRAGVSISLVPLLQVCTACVVTNIFLMPLFVI